MLHTFFFLGLLIFGVLALWLRDKGARAMEEDRRRALAPSKAAPAPSTTAPARLGLCPDCGTEVSLQTPSCPKCGAPLKRKADLTGAWCPQCGNRDSSRETKAGCLYMLLVLCSFGLALLLWPILPRCLRWIGEGKGWLVFGEIGAFAGTLALGLAWVARMGGFVWDRTVEGGSDG